MSAADTTAVAADGAGPVADTAALLDGLRDLRDTIVQAEDRVADLYAQRMAIYLALRARNVQFADIDAAAGNKPGAARAAIGKHRKRTQRPTADT